MADIHGQYDRFRAMLELIDFAQADRLFILGDVVDRGPHGIQLLEHIMAAPNMTMLLGNHEYMCLITFRQLGLRGGGDHWRKRCGGEVTYQALNTRRTPRERESILSYLDGLPDHLELTLGTQCFHLVHGMPADNKYDRVWKRPTPDTPRPFPDRTVVVGHTPTCELGQPFTIWHGDGLIDIDCGCGEDAVHGKLGCLRLDDGAEFYL